MLSLKGFFPSSDKVRQVEFHPVLTWAVSATKSDLVTVWDWRTKQVIWSAQFGGSEDDLCADAELARLHQRDAVFTPNPSLLHPIPGGGGGGAKREPAGHVRDVRFLDCDVAQVQLTWQHNCAYGCGTPPPRAEDIRALRGQRLLVIACDAKVIVLDLTSFRVVELGRGVFEKQPPSALAFLFRGGPGAGGAAGTGAGGLMESPVLAVGCADGVVRCVQLFPVKPMVRLVSAHKTPIVALTALAVRGQRTDLLAVGHQGGRVVLFEPMVRPPGPLPEGLGPRSEYKAHERELLPGSLAVVPLEEDPEATRVLLVTAGSDHRVCGVEPSALKAGTTSAPSLSKLKVERASVTCLAAWPRGWAACGVHSLLLGTETGHLLLAHPGSGSVRQAADLEGMVPAGHKRNPKIYGLCVHPMVPGLVAVATNTGTAVLALAGPPQPLPLAPLPLTAPSQALHQDETAAALGAMYGGGTGSGGATYVAAMGKQVLCVTAATLPNQDLSEYPPNQVMGKLQISGDTPGTKALVTVSQDGGYVAVAWPGARQYAVYRQGASAWQEVTRGTGTSVAWHASRPVFAALEEDPMSTAGAAALAAAAGGAGPGGKVSRDPKKAEKQAEAARAAMEAAAKAAAATAAVRMQELTAGGLRPFVGGGGAGGALELRGDVPAYVQGGPLLAVTVRRALQAETPDLAPAGSPHAPALLLFDWDTGRRVGPELPEPTALAWDPSRSMLALAYPSQLLVVRARPDFQVVSTLPVAGAESLEWASRQLYIATPTHILLALLAPAQPPLPPSAAAAAAVPTTGAATASSAAPARLIALAGPGVAVGAAAVGAVTLEGLLPPPATRPPGPVALLGPRDGNLWMVGVWGQPLALALTHPGLRCCCLVASGDLQGAVSLASRVLSPELHDPLAALMLEMEGLRGAAAAAALPGISLRTELGLRALLRHWQQAVEAAEGMLAGHTRRPAPGGQQFRSVVAAAAFGAGGVGGGGGLGGAGGGPRPLGEEFVDLSQAAGGKPATAPAHPEDLDWTQPLRAAGSSAKAAATALLASRPPLPPTPYGPGAAAVAAPLGSCGPPSSAAVQLVLDLMEDLERAALYDVVRHLAKLVAGHAVHLGGQQLRRLAGMMAQAGMKADLPSLAHSVAAGADSSSREAAGLLAALLSGHTALVQDSLREDGAAALAALQARVYGLSGAADSLAAWRRQLGAAAPPGAAATLGRLDVTVPV